MKGKRPLEREGRGPLLFLPGPTEVAEEVVLAGATPMIGHRGPEITALLRSTMEWTARLLHHEGFVFPLASSATGAMEGAVRRWRRPFPHGRFSL